MKGLEGQECQRQILEGTATDGEFILFRGAVRIEAGLKFFCSCLYSFNSKMIAAAYSKQWASRVSESYHSLSKLFPTCILELDTVPDMTPAYLI